MAASPRLPKEMGPLEGVRVVELAGIGPGPFCAMLLSDMGANVLRVDRIAAVDQGPRMDPQFSLLNRGRRSVAIDLKNPQGLAAARVLIRRADVLIEGFRPGVTERLGLGSDDCLALNPKLIYGRVTGWGQDGPLAHSAGHDINYIALTGVLDSIGPKEGPPIPPLNLVGDFGGGALYLAFGILCALVEREKSGRGQVVDAAMVDGAASLITGAYGQIAAGTWIGARASNIVDGGAPWYSVYQAADGKYICIGAIEGRFYAELLRLTGMTAEDLPDQHDRAGWPRLRARFAEVFKTKTQAEWRRILEGTDACFAPVLTLREAPEHPHNKARNTFIEIDGVIQPGPAPRFSRTVPGIPRGPAKRGQHTDEALQDWGFTADQIEELRRSAALA